MNARKFYNSNTGQFSIYIPDVNAMLERGGEHLMSLLAMSQDYLMGRSLSPEKSFGQTGQTDGMNRLNRKYTQKQELWPLGRFFI